jgi:hypothetical protein
VEYGVEPLVNEVLYALELSREATDWIAPVESQAGVAEVLRSWARYLASKQSN